MEPQVAVALIAGLACLAGGAECLVRGAARLAAAIGISPLVVGLTVVAYGTGAPELTVSVLAAARGNGDIAVANVVGSNILNVLLILGVGALVVPMAVARQVVRREVPVMILVSFLIWGLGFDGRLNRLDGGLLLAMLVGYTVWIVRRERREKVAGDEALSSLLASVPAAPPQHLARHILLQLVFVLVGLTLLVLGSHWLVEAATQLARAWGVSDVVIGLTVVAVGTSLPELAATLAATLRNHGDIAIGNVVGSNIFNLLGILGLSSLPPADGLAVASTLLHFDMPVMVAAAVACLPIFSSGMSIARWEGGVFLVGYVGYTTYLVLEATGHQPFPWIGRTLWVWVAPLLAMTAIVLIARAVRMPPR